MTNPTSMKPKPPTMYLRKEPKAELRYPAPNHLPFILTVIKEGPFPVFYEPAESPYKDAFFQNSKTPGIITMDSDKNKLAPQGDPMFPTAMTTYHMTEHWLSGAMTRHVPWLVQLQPQTFIEISPEMAEEIGIQSGN